MQNKIEICGLFSKFDVSLDFGNEALILIGPNGAGKSTVANIFYYLLSGQWQKLYQIDFQELKVQFKNLKIEISREDLALFDENFYDRSNRYSPTMLERTIDTLQKLDDLDKLTKPGPMKSGTIEQIARRAAVPRSLIVEIRRMVATGHNEDLFHKHLRDLRTTIDEKVTDKIFYLPTYRRIEKELIPMRSKSDSLGFPT